MLKDNELDRVNRQIKRIKAKLFDTRFLLIATRDKKQPLNGRIYIQARYCAACNQTGQLGDWGGRKWYLSDHMSDDEIIKTCWIAFKMAVEHEIMEGFKVDGKILFNPHVDHRALLEVSDKEVYRN